MNFDDAITSHILWTKAFLHYVNSSEDAISLNNLVKHLNVNASLFDKAFKIFGVTRSKLDAELISNTHNCTLGKWIDEMDEIFKENKDFIKLTELHNKFHKISGQIINHIANNDKDAVSELVHDDSEFHKLSNDIEVEIIRIKRFLNSN